MNDNDARELRRKLEQARRLEFAALDQTTAQRLRHFAAEISEKLSGYFERRRHRKQIRLRAYQLWEQNGRPVGRDVEFWLRAEGEIGQTPED